MYVAELDRFYTAHQPVLATEHSIDSIALGSHMAPYAANAISFWHLGRLGVLSIAYHELRSSIPPENEPLVRERLIFAADCIIDLMNAQSSATYPLLDIQHIELFLTWRALWAVRYEYNISEWLKLLIHRLGIRKDGESAVPHISPYGWNHLLEQAGRGLSQKVQGQSSYLLCMLAELAFSLPEAEREGICRFIVKRVANGPHDKTSKDAIYLTLWTPDKGWGAKILKGRATDGIEISADLDTGQESEPIVEQIERFVIRTRAQYPPEPPPIYRSVLALACLKHQSPLPPEFWRAILFPVQDSAIPSASA